MVATRPFPVPVRTRHFDSPEQEAYLALWRTYDRLKALEDEFFAGWGLTAQQYNALRLLKGERPRGLPTLALVKRLVSRAPDVTRMLDKLEALGLVSRRRPEEDRRSVRVSITPAGVDILGAMAAPLKAYHARQLGHLPESDLQDLVRLLRSAAKPHEPLDSHWLESES